MSKLNVTFIPCATLGWSRVVFLWVLAFAWSSFSILQAAPSADGLYATFRVKRGASLVGEFTCQLAFDKAPQTVANFIGLADGSLPWMDFQKGHAVKRPLYNGVTFHRVVANFVIQGGSPDGRGSGGPGYNFRDEFNPTLRHSKTGILSMANSGLHSNGSQFFITLAAKPALDDVHSVFGEVVEGLSVVLSVQQGDVIESVVVTRNGAAARAFDVTAHGLPSVLEAQPRLQPVTGGFQLDYPKPPNTEFFVFHTDDLGTWNPLPGMELYGVAPSSAPRDVSSVTANRVQKFFNVAKVQYPDAIYTPPSVTGRKLTLAEPGNVTLAFSFASATKGTFTITQNGAVLGPFNVTDYGWNQEAYRGQFTGGISGLSFGGLPVTDVDINFVFNATGGGTYGGSFFTLFGDQLVLGGTFSVSGL